MSETILAFDADAVASAHDHLAITDALLRFGAGVDDGDAKLVTSAFSDDAVVDFAPCGQKMRLDFPLMTGGETIASFLGLTSRLQTTSHVVTNARVRVEGHEAHLRALVDATHRPKDDHSRHCRMMNWYDARLIRDGTRWRMRRLVIDNVWFTGDARILLER